MSSYVMLPSPHSSPHKPTDRRLRLPVSATRVRQKLTNGHGKGAIDDFGLRVGSVKATAASMYARKAGATLAEVRAAVGSVQFNVLRELENKGFQLDRQQEAGHGGRKATRYFLHTK